jgi:tetratricopeptide (TPR) repeat protein
MAQESMTSAGLEKAKAFFTRAEEAAFTAQFDYAIEMYLQGLKWSPDALGEGHIPLRQTAIVRRDKGGKKPSMMDKLKRAAKAKDPVEEMLNQEWLFSHDPDNMGYAESFMKAAVAAGCKKISGWLADLVYEANLTSSKPSFNTFMMLKEAYATSQQWDKAIRVMQQAVKLKPDDLALADELKNASAELAMAQGRYDQGDFRNSLKDKAGQEKLQAQDAVVKTENYKELAIKAARENLEKNPESNDALIKLADTLEDIGGDDNAREAVKILDEKYGRTHDFILKRRANEIKIKFLKRLFQNARAALEANPQKHDVKAHYDKVHSQLVRMELEHYRQCVEQYPTDNKMKFEYASRLMKNKQYDEAIPLFQESQKDPRHRFLAMDRIGMCFFSKGWFSDAEDICRRAADAYEMQDDATAKDLRYNLARSLEEQNKNEEAIEIYRKLAQLDFGYKDVRKRVDELRKKTQ